MYLIISTLPHFLSILPLIKYYKYTYGYINIILLSTIFSILYHKCKESNNFINFMDYLFAGIWLIYDIYMGYVYTNKKILIKIILANIVVFIINIQIPYNVYYELNHSIWHIINVYKCFYVSSLISTGLTNKLILKNFFKNNTYTETNQQIRHSPKAFLYSLQAIIDKPS